MIKAINIEWDTDGEVTNLPEEVEIPELFIDLECCDDPLNCEHNSESINNYLSDTYGWTVFNYDLVKS